MENSSIESNCLRTIYIEHVRRVRPWLNRLRRHVFTQKSGVRIPVEERTFSQKSFSILSLTSSIVKAATEIAYNKCLHYYRWGLETEDIPVVCKRFLKLVPWKSAWCYSVDGCSAFHYWRDRCV